MERKKPEDLEEKGGASSGKGGKLGGLTVYIIGGIISLVLIILCSNFIGVTTKIYNKNNTSIDGEINSINALIKTMQTSIDCISKLINIGSDKINGITSYFWLYWFIVLC